MDAIKAKKERERNLILDYFDDHLSDFSTAYLNRLRDLIIGEIRSRRIRTEKQARRKKTIVVKNLERTSDDEEKDSDCSF